jgi:hypothetical protein
VKRSELSGYIAGFVMGGALAVVIGTWGEAGAVYRVIYVVLLSLLLFATWFKPKPHKGNGKTDNNASYTVVYKPSNESTDDTAKS